MTRYVNFDQMVDKINHELEHSLNSVYFCEDGTKISTDVGYIAEWFEDYVIRLHQIPLVDAVEVVHGKWIFDAYTQSYRCSNCEAYKPYETVGEYRDYWDCDYCNICGAKMDE